MPKASVKEKAEARKAYENCLAEGENASVTRWPRFNGKPQPTIRKRKRN